MAYDYVNTFKLDADPDGNPAGFHPDRDTDPTQTKIAVLRDMRFSSAGTADVDTDDQHPGPDGGFIVAFTNDSGQVASRTIYVVDPNNRLNSALTLFAELEFDSPRATNPDKTINYQRRWAVGLNFKVGNEKDGGPDEPRIGPTCQFFDGGYINFHDTDSDQSQPGNYDDYAGASTTFKLLVAVRRTASTFAAGGMLFLNNEPVFFGGIPDPGFGPLSGAGTSPANKITAVGVAIVDTGKDAAQVSLPTSEISVHLIAFRLFWGFPEIIPSRFPLF